MNEAPVIDPQWAHKSGARWFATLAGMRYTLGFGIGDIVLHADGTGEQVSPDPLRIISGEEALLLDLAPRLGQLDGMLFDPRPETMDALWPEGRETLSPLFIIAHLGKVMSYEHALKHYVDRVNGFQLKYARTIYGLTKAFLRFPRYSHAGLTAMVRELEAERARVEEAWIDPVDDPIYDEDFWE